MASKINLSPQWLNTFFGCCLFYGSQWRSQNAEKVTHIKRETTVSSNASLQLPPFSKWELLLKERIFSQREQIFSFKSSSLRYGNDFYHIRSAPLSVTIFIMHVRILHNMSYAIGSGSAVIYSLLLPIVVDILCLVLDFVMQYFLVLQSSPWGRERAGCLTFIVFWMSCSCYCYLTLPHSAVSWSVVCYCGISLSYSLAFS